MGRSGEVRGHVVQGEGSGSKVNCIKVLLRGEREREGKRESAREEEIRRVCLGSSRCYCCSFRIVKKDVGQVAH